MMPTFEIPLDIPDVILEHVEINTYGENPHYCAKYHSRGHMPKMRQTDHERTWA